MRGTWVVGELSRGRGVLLIKAARQRVQSREVRSLRLGRFLVVVVVMVVEVRVVVHQPQQAEVGTQIVHQLAPVAHAALVVEVELAWEDRREDVELLLGRGRHGDGGGGGRLAAPGAAAHLEIHLGVLGGPRKARLVRKTGWTEVVPEDYHKLPLLKSDTQIMFNIIVVLNRTPGSNQVK